jgi:hypothetical protein
MKKNDEYQTKLMDVFIGLAQATRCFRQDTAFCGGVTFHQFIILNAAAKKQRSQDFRFALPFGRGKKHDNPVAESSSREGPFNQGKIRLRFQNLRVDTHEERQENPPAGSNLP